MICVCVCVLSSYEHDDSALRFSALQWHSTHSQRCLWVWVFRWVSLSCASYNSTVHRHHIFHYVQHIVHRLPSQYSAMDRAAGLVLTSFRKDRAHDQTLPVRFRWSLDRSACPWRRVAVSRLAMEQSRTQQWTSSIRYQLSSGVDLLLHGSNRKLSTLHGNYQW